MKGEKVSLLVLGAAHSLNHSLFLVLPPLLGEISRDLGAPFTALGVVAAVTFLIYGAGALVGGPLSDLLGGVRVVRLSAALAGASALLFTLARDLATFSGAMFVMAFWASFYHPTSNNLISKAFTRHTAEAMGLHGAAGSVGQVFTPAAAYLIGALIGWRFAFVAFGLLSVLVALTLGRTHFDEGGDRRGGWGEAPLAGILKTPGLGAALLYNVVVGLFSRGVELFMPAFLSLNRGLSGGLAAVSSSAVLLFGVLGQYAGGRGADRFGSTRVILASSAGVLSSLLLLLLAPAGPGVVFFVVLYGIAFFSHQPAMTSLVGAISPRALSGVAYGLMFFSTFGLGSLSAAIAGYLADALSLEMAFWFMALFAAVSLAISMAILKTLKR